MGLSHPCDHPNIQPVSGNSDCHDLVSRWFRRDVNRWLNIVASVLTLLYVLGGGNWEASVILSLPLGSYRHAGDYLAGVELAQ